MEALRVGQHALLIECADSDAVTATYELLRDHASALGAVEVVPAARTVLLDGLVDPEAARALLATLTQPRGGARPDGPLVELPTVYDGADLAEVARQWGCSTAEVRQIHQAATFVVTFCGFAPGFAYCTGLGPEHAVARRPEPRAAVPPGSVALAGRYTGVYPASSPGGWQLIGTTSATLWSPQAVQPSLLLPGTRVRFVDG